ncbi:hypothetical protein AVEN_189160-1, partial [Araneus ventricosus]
LNSLFEEAGWVDDRCLGQSRSLVLSLLTFFCLTPRVPRCEIACRRSLILSFWWTVVSYGALSLHGLPHGSSTASYVTTAGFLVACGFFPMGPSRSMDCLMQLNFFPCGYGGSFGGLWFPRGASRYMVASWQLNCFLCDYGGIFGGLWFPMGPSR